jgi:hypothetical protein
MAPFFVDADLFGAANSAVVATPRSTVRTGPVQGFFPGSPQSACAVAGAAIDAQRSNAAVVIFMRGM